MKVGMNSQTLRIIGGDKVYDYNITDGTTASKFMKIVGGATITEDTLKEYTRNSVADEKAPMSWGKDNDKMTDIEYTSVGSESGMINSDTPDRSSGYGYGYPTYSAPRRSAPGTSFYQPIRKPVRQTPPPPRHDYSKTQQNEENFKKLFGK